MDELTMDLRDTRGRLIRFSIAVTVGILVTIVALHAIRSVAVTPNADPIAGSSVVLLAVGILVVSSALALGVVTAIARRFR